MRRLAWLPVFAALAFGCGTASLPTTDAPPATIAPPSADSPPAPSSSVTGEPVATLITTADCSAEPEGWTSFCRAYELISSRFVDAVDDAVLAKGAASGLVDFPPEGTNDRISGLTCALPTSAFETFCSTLAGVPDAGQVQAADWAVSAIQGMVAGLGDPHSAYLSPEAVEREREDDAGEVEGIGALVSAVDPNGQTCALLSAECRLTIVGTISGSPADAAGIQEGDVLIGVDGKPIAGLHVDTVVSLVRGPAGTEVVLKFDRAGSEFEVTLQRAAVTIPIVTAELLEPRLGYIQLTLFTDDSPERVRAALEDLFDRGARDVILDLQDNPGGTLDAAVQIASEFLRDGLVLRTEGPVDSTDYPVRPGGIATGSDIRLVVLMNEASASASEVVAAALQESGRATVIGELSFGKNTVQQQFSLDNGGALKLTIARWVTAEGEDYGERGVVPDVLIEVGPDDPDDHLLEAARAYLTGA